MKRLVIGIVLILSLKSYSQSNVIGDWYFISTEQLMHLRIEKDAFSWNEETYLFKSSKGEGNDRKQNSLVNVISSKNLVMLISNNQNFIKDSVTGDADLYELTVLQYDKKPGTLNLMMNCCGVTRAKDTADIQNVFNACDTSSRMRMKYYTKKTIDEFSLLKSVNFISPKDSIEINRLFEKEVKFLTNKYGEGKLLWIAPVLFQQVLTELLVNYGYNPMLTKKQADELFSFYYY